MRIAVLGPGNSFHSDDSISLLVVRHIQKLLENPGELSKFYAEGR